MDQTNHQKYYNRCITEYNKILTANSKIDAGHSINHVKTVEQLTSEAVKEFLENIPSQKHLEGWLAVHPSTSLPYPADFQLRVMAASLLHEVGDKKLLWKANLKLKKNS